MAAEKRHRDAFVDTVKGDVLLRTLKKKNSDMERKINNYIVNKSSGGLSLKGQYEKDISELGDKIHILGLSELEVRENEVKLFEESIENAQNETQAKGVRSIEGFLDEKEALFNKLYDLQLDFEAIDF